MSVRRVRQEKPELPILHIGESVLDRDDLLHDVPTLREPFTQDELLAAVMALIQE